MTTAKDSTSEQNAIDYKLAGELLIRHGETLRLAAIGQLEAVVMPNGDVLMTIADQVKHAETEIAAQIARLSPPTMVAIDRGYGIDAS